jgi:hypothetical protein
MFVCPTELIIFIVLTRAIGLICNVTTTRITKAKYSNVLQRNHIVLYQHLEITAVPKFQKVVKIS